MTKHIRYVPLHNVRVHPLEALSSLCQSSFSTLEMSLLRYVFSKYVPVHTWYKYPGTCTADFVKRDIMA